MPSPCSAAAAGGISAWLSYFLSWNGLASVFAVLAAIVLVVERFFLDDKQIDRIQQLLIRWWDHLDDAQVRDYPRHLASRTESLLSTLTAKSKFRAVTVAVVFSWLLTTAAYAITPCGNGSVGEFFKGLPFADDYVVNFVFDLATLFVFVVGLRTVRRSGMIAASLTGLAVVGLSCLLAIASVATMEVSRDVLDRHYFPALAHIGLPPPEPTGGPACFLSIQVAQDRVYAIGNKETVHLTRRPLSFWLIFKETALAYASLLSRSSLPITIRVPYTNAQGLQAFLTFTKAPAVATTYDLAFGATTLVPVTMFMLTLVFLWFAKLLTILGRRIALRFLDLAAAPGSGSGNGFLPGTRLAILLGLFTALAKVLASAVP